MGFSFRLFNKKIDIYNEWTYSIGIWNDNILFIGCKDNTIKFIDFSKGKIIQNLIGHNDKVLTIKKIYHPKYGNCLISQNSGNSEIKLWINN